VSGMQRLAPDLHSSSGACAQATPRAATCQPPHDMHALEDLSVSGCDQLARDFGSSSACVRKLDASRSNLSTLPTCALEDLSVNGCISSPDLQQQRACVRKLDASRSYLTTLP
jgi:hypothetical protein